MTLAENLLHHLGVTDPSEIDLEAIAFYLGVRVRYRHLDGCEARIVGNGDSAIITINSRSSNSRMRFSIAHELGHWHHHRGKALVCRAEEYRPRDQLSPERIADCYAADLLMPHYLFRPAARQYPRLDFKTVSDLATAFDASITAAAIRLVEEGHSPALLVCHCKQGRKWFARGPAVPTRWFPRDDLDADSFAFAVLFGRKPDDLLPRKIGADAWFDRQEAVNYEVHEQTLRTGEDEILTLLLVRDPAMLEDVEDRRGGRR